MLGYEEKPAMASRKKGQSIPVNRGLRLRRKIWVYKIFSLRVRRSRPAASVIETRCKHNCQQ
jgi:hypothetical protein